MVNKTNKNSPTILSIDTSCDETSAAITKGLHTLSSVIWSQAKTHAKYGGVVPSVAVRKHESKIPWVLKRTIEAAQINVLEIDAFSVTVGPGLAVSLGVGIKHAKELALKYNKPLIAVNHLEGHILSPLAGNTNKKIPMSENIISRLFPSFGIVVSGGNTLLVLIDKIGSYKILAQTIDDALGESLDKSARLLGLGYPGGAILEKFAKHGNPKKYTLPIPMLGREDEGNYSYSGIKTAFARMYSGLPQNKINSRQTIYDLTASYQNTAFNHFFRVTNKIIENQKNENIKYLLVGGGVAANVDFRKRVRAMCKSNNLTPLFPYRKKLYGDNAVMIGVAAYFKYLERDFIDPDKIDRLPNLKINEVI